MQLLANMLFVFIVAIGGGLAALNGAFLHLCRSSTRKGWLVSNADAKYTGSGDIVKFNIGEDIPFDICIFKSNEMKPTTTLLLMSLSIS